MLYNEASSWSVRPSTLLDLQDPYTAFCFDQAINYWGKTIEGELEKVEGKNAKDTELRRKSILEKYLYPDGDGSSKHQFSDPALMFM